MPSEGWIAEHVGAVCRWEDSIPVKSERVADVDVRRALQWDTSVALPKFKAQQVVHDVVHHPHRCLGNAPRELSQLRAVELIHVDPGKLRNVQQSAELTISIPLIVDQLSDEFDLQQAQFSIGDDQEVAAAAGRIEEPHAAKPLVESLKLDPPATVLS